MSRVIKFRAWDNKDKRFCPFPFLVRNDGLVFRQYHGGGHVEDYTVMQFTGLHDKNGKEIYEGDVIDLGVGEEKHPVVQWDNEYSCFTTMLGKGTHLFGIHLAEIIGNIYENPDLLKN